MRRCEFSSTHTFHLPFKFQAPGQFPATQGWTGTMKQTDFQRISQTVTDWLLSLSLAERHAIRQTWWMDIRWTLSHIRPKETLAMTRGSSSPQHTWEGKLKFSGQTDEVLPTPASVLGLPEAKLGAVQDSTFTPPRLLDCRNLTSSLAHHAESVSTF